VTELKRIHGETAGTPGLAVVQVGGRLDSATYVNMKEKVAGECGFLSLKTLLDEKTEEKELLSIVQGLNADSRVDGKEFEKVLAPSFLVVVVGYGSCVPWCV